MTQHQARGAPGLDVRTIDLPDEPLTPREIFVLGQMAAGHRAATAAAETHHATETIRSHIRNAKGKLGARTVTEAVAKAIRRGLL